LLKSYKTEFGKLGAALCKPEGLNAAQCRLAYDDVALTLLLQLLPAKHSRQPCVSVTNAHLFWDRSQPDTQALQAALLLQDLAAWAEQCEEWKASVDKSDIQVRALRSV
jgi:hypothetical protein